MELGINRWLGSSNTHTEQIKILENGFNYQLSMLAHVIIPVEAWYICMSFVQFFGNAQSVFLYDIECALSRWKCYSLKSLHGYKHQNQTSKSNHKVYYLP